ncbi:MAG: hypothetical protein QFX32_03365 [Methanolinea sp.]|nr:hypothetical protein [Methanolinea sp.]
MQKSAVLAFLVTLALLLCGGCVSVLTQTGGGEGVSATANGTALRATLVRQDADWGISRGCTWETVFQVYNPGTTRERNVYLHVELLNADTGVVRDTKELFIGALGPGEERTVTIELDGECLKQYTVRAIPVTKEP